MFKYFDSTFFKFLFGFMALIALSFVITFIALESQGSSQSASVQTIDVAN